MHEKEKIRIARNFGGSDFFVILQKCKVFVTKIDSNAEKNRV